MMRSMFSGVSGLRVHQSRMDVIGNNIANVNTIGYKSSRMTFADAFSQTLQGASAPNPAVGRAGTNPMQVGLGANIGSIQRLMSTGGAQRTDDPFHLMIEGDGFFVVGDAVGGMFFTRAGNFQTDRNFNIGLPSGLMLQGWPANTTPTGNLEFNAQGQTSIVMGPVQGIQITPGMRQVPPTSTRNVEISGNINPADGTTQNFIPFNFNLRDSLGTNYRLDMRLVLLQPPDPNAGQWQIQRSNLLRPTAGGDLIHFPDTGDVNSPPTAAQVETWIPVDTQGPGNNLQFDISGNLIFNSANNDGAVINITIPTGNNGTALSPARVFGAHTGDGSAGAPFVGGPITVDFRQLSVADGPTLIASEDVDGLAVGQLIGLSIGGDGVVTGTYSNGESFALWQVALARFDNPAGMAALGGNLFATTPNSGLFDGIGLTPGAAGTQLLGCTLEMSNVDLASEFTEMITTQRGFQSNSRVISTSDEILQELVNLRR